MDAYKMGWNSGTAGFPKTRHAGDFVLRALGSLRDSVRFVLHAVLKWLSPFVAIFLIAWAVVGYSTCGFVYLFVYKSHFPMGFTLLFSTGCLFALVLYHAGLYLLDPDSH
jgi:hypothetical protein